ncbi:MAG: hypothetical protein ACI94D_002136, partial [Neolewinella sp.]
SLKSLANTTALSTFFASPAVKIHQIKKHVLFNSRPLKDYSLNNRSKRFLTSLRIQALRRVLTLGKKVVPHGFVHRVVMHNTKKGTFFQPQSVPSR